MPRHNQKIIFVTGTDTGVGKTLLTALLLRHLRQTGVRALAMKPFCSGGRGDVELLQSIQPGELADHEANPFYFKEPIAPLVAAKSHRQVIRLAKVLQSIRKVEKKCDVLLVEGSGGLLVPLGDGYNVADIIVRLNCRVIVAARNQLGTINHTLLTIQALRSRGIPAAALAVVLMSGPKPDASSRDNHAVLSSLIHSIPVLKFPFFGPKATRIGRSVTIGTGTRKALNWLAFKPVLR